MHDRIDPSTWPSDRGPWPEVTDNARLFDQGASWCINAHGHPSGDRDYPDPDVHFPFHECQTPSMFLDDVRADVNGTELDLAVYGARPFLFGQARGLVGPARRRVVLDLCELRCGAGRIRFSLGLGDALLLAHYIGALVE